jgi:hypothetical protein
MTTKTHIQKLGRMIAVLAAIATVAAPIASADVWAGQAAQAGDALDRYVANISRQPDALDRYLANQGTRPDNRALPVRVGDALDRYLGNAASTARPDDRAVLPRVETPTTISAGSASQFDWGRIGIGVGAGVAVLLIMGMAFTNRRRLAHT